MEKRNKSYINKKGTIVCPHCKEKELTRYEINKGYQCPACTQAEEWGYLNTVISG